MKNHKVSIPEWYQCEEELGTIAVLKERVFSEYSSKKRVISGCYVVKDRGLEDLRYDCNSI